MFDEKGMSRRDADDLALLPLKGLEQASPPKPKVQLEFDGPGCLLLANGQRADRAPDKQALDADLFEIETAEAYPEDYQAMVAQAEREREAGESRRSEDPSQISRPIRRSFSAFYLGDDGASPIRSFLTARPVGQALVRFIAWRLQAG